MSESESEKVLEKFFNPPIQSPTEKAVSNDNGTSAPADDSDADLQVNLSIEIEDGPFGRLIHHHAAEVEATRETAPDTLRLTYPADFSIDSDAVSGQVLAQIYTQTITVITRFSAVKDGISFTLGSKSFHIPFPGTPEELAELHKLLKARDAAQKARGKDTPSQAKPSKQIIPKRLAQFTFIEARAIAHALSDAPTLTNWQDVEGAIALLHSPPNAKHQVRFEPNALLTTWWGYPTPADKQALWNELKTISFEGVVTFYVVLAGILRTDKARWTTSLDDLIKMIGRDTDARRSESERRKLRREVWRYLLLFDSLPVIGARTGIWKEPAPKGVKRDKMAQERLISRDPLLRIVGTRATEQTAFDNSEPPKEVSLVAGEWLMQFHGNREFLAEFGDVLSIASIPRRRPSGAWAACIGFALQQAWRELATRTKQHPVKRGKDSQIEAVFRPFTRRELLTQTYRSDYDVEEILKDPKSGHRAREYWTGAIKKLKEQNVIGHYSEGKEPATDDWREGWLDQPLIINPKDERLAAVFAIQEAATEAKKRGQRQSKKPENS
jgi:hypothetical protein